MIWILRTPHVTQLFRWEKRLIARFVATSVATTLSGMAVILLIREFLDGAMGVEGGLMAWFVALAGAPAAIWLLAGSLLLAYLLGSVANYDNRVCQQRIVKVLELGMMERLIWRLLTLSVPFFDRQSHGDVIQAVRQDVSQMRQAVESAANVLLNGLLTVGLFAAAFWVSPRLSMWAFIGLPLAALPVLLLARRTLERSYLVRQTGYALFDVVLQILRGIRVIKAYRGEGREAAASVVKGRQYFDELIEMVRIRSFSQVVMESIAGFGVVLVVVVGGMSVMSGDLSWAQLTAFLLAVRQLHGPIDNVHRNYVQMKTYGASVERIVTLLDARPQVVDRPGARRLEAPPSRIAFDRVRFSYEGEEEPALAGISFEVRAGETIGIAGASGSGKSTLLNLLVRFYDPVGGRVLFDGVDLREYRLADVYDKVAIVTQEPFLFSATVRENIRCGRRGASDEEVEAAARAAFVHGEILELPSGYDTPIGPGGRGLSGGQTQRINVARAILKNAPILLLDEATSSLDSISESEVQRAIEPLMGNRTTFVVAHRLSTLRRADRILLLEQGRLVAVGSHEQLRAESALYRELWSIQSFAPAC